MRREIRVLIVEEDPFARQWMALILARDWRTQLVGEVDELNNPFFAAIRNVKRIDLILLDADLVNPSNLQKIQSRLADKDLAKVLVIGNSPSQDVQQQIVHNPVCVGYILKSEIKYSLAWAADFCTNGKWVITPGLLDSTLQNGTKHQESMVILDGRKTISKLTNHEIEVARLALIFSMERRDLSREIKISDNWGNGLVTELYKKLGLPELLSGEVRPEDYFGNQPVILDRVNEILTEMRCSKKTQDKESLSFHILTMPEVSY